MGAELNGKQLQEAENDAAVKVKVSGLSKYFPVRKKKGIGAGEFCAIKDLNLEIRTGEFLTVVGPSGCGKSTFLEIMAGLSKPSTGTILIDGKKVTGPAMDRGVVFQGYALLPWRTVRGNVEYGLEIKKIPPKERHEISSTYIKMVGLENFADNYPHELSGGMRQRVAIARTLAFNPEVLLMDEPFAAVDAQTRETLQDELVKIWEKTNKTIIFITHSIEEAVFLGDRVVVMSPNPGTIKKILPVKIGRPRLSKVRNTMEFAFLRSEIAEFLYEENIKPGMFI